jgi:uncharacterized membrane protein YfcA
MVFNIIIYILAGLAAGVLTGFSGISAAVVVTPALVSMCGFDAYEAVGIAMASDVIASAATAYSYGKHGNLRVKDALLLMAAVLSFTFVGSWLGDQIPHEALGTISVLLTPLMGLKFLIFPQTSLSRLLGQQSKQELLIETLFIGAAIGTICGFSGAGGGEMLLFALTTILCDEVKEAVGTGVFIMAFVALVGCVSHIYIGGWPDMTAFIICIVGNFTGAVFAARIANKMSSATLNKIIGVFLTIVGLIMAVANFI